MNGGCHCGAIRYELQGPPNWSALCHCNDCRRHAGAPVVGWSAFPEDALRLLQGEPKVYESSEYGRRHFCADCGTGLFYNNAVNLPGIVDVQIAERIGWMERAHELPVFPRYPPQG